MPNGFFRQICKKRSKTEKEHHQRILHIQNSLGTKFQLKLTIWMFWDQINSKKVFPI